MGCLICEDNRMTSDSAETCHGLVSCAGGRFFYIARNDIQVGWQGDSESILIHAGGSTFSCRVRDTDGTRLSLDPEEVKQLAKVERHGFDPWPVMENDGRLKPHAIRDYGFDPARNPRQGGNCVIVAGPGIGQIRRVLDNDAQGVQLDRPWSIAPTQESRALFTQYELYDRLLIVDNVIGESGLGVMLWGNTYDTIVDGNQTARTAAVAVCGMTHHSPSGMNIGYFNQVLHNVCSAGRCRDLTLGEHCGWIGSITMDYFPEVVWLGGTLDRRRHLPGQSLRGRLALFLPRSRLSTRPTAAHRRRRFGRQSCGPHENGHPNRPRCSCRDSQQSLRRR